jgi:hypothetical protein
MTTKDPNLNLKLVAAVASDAVDIASLWLDPGHGDVLAETHHHSIAVGKPKGFFRVNPDTAYRRICEMYVHKIEGKIDETFYLIAPSMQGVLDEAQKCVLCTVINREGVPRLWALKLPMDGRDNEAWSSARSAAREAMTTWVKLKWDGRAYLTKAAQPGYAPEPNYSKLPPFDDLVGLAFNKHTIITSTEQPIVRDLLGAKPEGGDDGLS